MSKSGSFDVHYDADSDVLYVRTGCEAAARGVEDENGIVWRHESEGAVIGATVVDFRRRWLRREHILADELSRRFRLPAADTRTAIEHALAGGRSPVKRARA
jgi:uncharacterized protein YuzE